MEKLVNLIKFILFMAGFALVAHFDQVAINMGMLH
jgi:hypothetical protein